MHQYSDNTPLNVNMLGHPHVLVGDVPITGFVSSRAECLFYYLLYDQKIHSRESLAAMLWPDKPEQVARTNLRTVLANLRKTAGDYLIITRQTVAFDKSKVVEIDALQFKAELTNEDASIETLHATIDLYRGEFLTGLTFSGATYLEEWITTEQEHLHILYLSGLTQLAQRYKNQLRHVSAIEILKKLLELEPFDQDAHHQLISILAESGNYNEALAQYERCRQLFLAEFDVEPPPKTVALYDKIKRGKIHIPYDLPAPTTPYIGRLKELDKIYERLANPNCRLVTLVAIGGAGKTRTAVKAARTILQEAQSRTSHRFADGIFFVPLAQIGPHQDTQSEQRQIIKLVGRRVGLMLEESDDEFEQLSRLLSTKQMLIILDQAEHLESIPKFIFEFLRSTYSVKLLVTSRIRLGLNSEWVVQLRGLAIPTTHQPQSQSSDATPSQQLTQYSSAQLFLSCAKRHDVSIELSAKNQDAIISICQSVNGSPLGIELASTWLPILSLHEIATGLSDDIALVAQPRVESGVESNMKVTYDYSWRLLTDEEQRALRLLAYFTADFTREAALAVAKTDRTMLALLHDKSLLSRTEEGHFIIHDTLRQYLEQYQPCSEDESAQVRDAHCRHYFLLVESLGEKMYGPEAHESIQILDGQISNIQKAWEHAVDTKAAEAIWSTIHGIRLYFNITGQHQTAVAWWTQALDIFIEPCKIRGALLACQADSLRLIGKSNEGIQSAIESHEIFQELDNFYGVKQALIVEGICLWTDGHHNDAQSVLEKVVSMIDSATEKDLYAQANFGLGVTYERQLAHLSSEKTQEERDRLFLQSKQALEETLAVAHELDNMIYAGYAYSALGLLYTRNELYQEAHICLEEAQVLFSASAHSLRIINQRTMAEIYMRTGEFALASQMLVLAMQRAQSSADGVRLLVLVMVSAATWAWHSGNYSNATQLAVFLLKQPLLTGRYKVELSEILTDIKERISPLAYQLAETRGSLMSINQANKLVLSWFQEKELNPDSRINLN